MEIKELFTRETFTIIIPVYNRQDSIIKALKSVKDQTFTNFRCFVVDDNSIDNSVAVIEDYIVDDNRFTLLKHKENQGAAAARNTAIRVANGMFISFLDSDDFFENTFLEETYKIITSSPESVGFMWTGYRLSSWNEGVQFLNEKCWAPNIIEDSYITFLNSLQVGIGAGVTIKKELFDSCGLFDEGMPAAEDTDFFLRISRNYDFTYSNKILINIERGRNDRLSKRFDKIHEAYIKLLPAHLPTINKYKRLRIKYNYKMQWLSYYGKNKSAARKYFKKVIQDDFFNKRSWAVLVLFEILGIRRASKIHEMLSNI